MSLEITHIQQQGKPLELPAQTVLVKTPDTQNQDNIVNPVIPRMNIIFPQETLYRFSNPILITWALNSPMILNTTILSYQDNLLNSIFFKTLTDEIAARMRFDPTRAFATLSFDIVFQFFWPSSPAFQGELLLMDLRNFSGIGLTLVDSVGLSATTFFPNYKITPSEEGTRELRYTFTLPIGPSTLRFGGFSLDGGKTFTRHPFYHHIIGAFRLYVMSALRTTTAKTSYDILRRHRFDNVSFNYLSGYAASSDPVVVTSPTPVDATAKTDV